MRPIGDRRFWRGAFAITGIFTCGGLLGVAARGTYGLGGAVAFILVFALIFGGILAVVAAIATYVDDGKAV